MASADVSGRCLFLIVGLCFGALLMWYRQSPAAEFSPKSEFNSKSHSDISKQLNGMYPGPTAPCDHPVLREHVDLVSTEALASAWLRELPGRVGSLLDASTYSTNNERCIYDSTNRRCRRKGKIDAVQPYGHARFSFLEPMPICGPNNEALTTFGRPGSDGHKLVCGVQTLAASNQTVVFSLGSNNNFVFEEEVVRVFGRQVRIHTFDCTVDEPRVPAAIASNVIFHKVCIGPRDELLGEKRRVYRTWGTLVDDMRSQGQLMAPPDLFKIDIEGYERDWLWSMLVGHERWLPRQILMELHFNTLTPSGEWHGNVGLRLTSTGELAMLAQLWHTRGYRLVAREDNPQSSSCTEINLLLVDGCNKKERAKVLVARYGRAK